MKTYWLMPLIKDYPTKTFQKQSDGSWKKIKDYPPMKHFKGIVQEVDDLKDFYKILKMAAKKKVFMIHGAFKEGIDTARMLRKSRDNDGEATCVNRMLDLFCIDVDNYPLIDRTGHIVGDGIKSIDKFIQECLPEQFSKCDYVYQFSSSFGFTDDPVLKAHLFFTPKNHIHNENLRKWAIAWNKETGKNHIDPAVYRAVQPIYTAFRKTENVVEDDDPWGTNENLDPINHDEMIGYCSKGNQYLDWEPSDLEDPPKSESDSGNREKISVKYDSDYNLSESIRKIMTAENFHDQIRSTALSLINKNVTPKDTKIFIQEFMRVAKANIKDADRIEDWKARYDDIGRAVESAVEIVGKPMYEDILGWLQTADIETIKVEFPKKLISFEGTELKRLIREVDEVTGFGLRSIGEDIKLAKEEYRESLEELSRKIKSEERKEQGITEIEITNSNYGAVTTQVCRILSVSKREPLVFKLGNTISIIENSIPKTIRQITRKEKLQDDYPKMPIIHSIDSPVGVIRNRVEKDCVFVNGKGSEIVCPDSILNAVPRMYGINWNPLSGIVEHPFINDSFNLVAQEGYDPNTGLYAVLHHKLKVKLIEPKKAYDYMVNDVLAEFPFQTELDMVAALALFMTAVQRPYVIGDNGMPGFAIVSPKPSSGKTTLAQLLSYSIYNRPVAATGWSDNDEELGKHLLAILREGHSCVLFDNIKKDAAVASNELAKAMTSGTYSRRKLGVNETEEVPSSVLWMFTGNNIVFKGDFATRILPIRLVPKTEHPECRKFNRPDIGQWAMDNRKHIISASLSLVLAGKAVDYSKYETSSRFKEWNKFVRIPLLELTGYDLLDVFDRNDFLDDETIAKGELLELLYKTFGSKPFATKDIMNLMEGVHVKGANVAIDSTGNDFKHAIIESFNEKATINIKTLGRFILGMKDFILRGYMLTREDSKPVAKWKIVPIDEEQD